MIYRRMMMMIMIMMIMTMVIIMIMMMMTFSEDVSWHTLLDVQYVPIDDVQLDRVLFVSS